MPDQPVSPLLDLLTPTFWVIVVVSGIVVNVIWRAIGFVVEKLSSRLRDRRVRIRTKKDAETAAEIVTLGAAPARRVRVGIWAASVRVLGVMFMLTGAGIANVNGFFSALADTTSLKLTANVNIAFAFFLAATGWWMMRIAAHHWEIFRLASDLSDEALAKRTQRDSPAEEIAEN